MTRTFKKICGLALPVALLLGTAAYAGIHRAPIVVKGHKVRSLTRYPISTYRMFRTGPKGEAITIPFQIDELNEWGDYVLDKGGDITKNTGNGIFDLHDELVFMGDDVGPAKLPTKWEVDRPALIYELKFEFPGESPTLVNEGAVYVGIYFRKPPPLFEGKYVVFNQAAGEVVSSRYRYEFDKKNYLVVEGVDMIRKTQDEETGEPPKGNDKEPSQEQPKKEYIPLLDSSTFYMKADLKYFITVTANHRSVDSKIEAFKTGPVRSIVRVGFFYQFLKLRFELGMYTEVSFFTNSVILPAIIYNPLDGPNSLNSGSGFYYGFNVKDNPNEYKVDTNIPQYRKKGLLDFFRTDPKIESLYWLSMAKEDRMMYVEIAPSEEMRKDLNIPFLYLEEKSGEELAKRKNDEPLELGESPVNLGLFFDLTKFTEGEHRMAFRLFFENAYSEKQLESFKVLDQWKISVQRL